jgi:hypothetical protein
MAARTYLARLRCRARIGGRLAAIAWTFGAPTSAAAAEPPAAEPAVVVAPVEYSGDIPKHLRKDIEKVVLEALDGVELAPLDARVKFNCRTLACAVREAREGDLDHVIVVRVTAEDRDYDIVIEAHASSDGRVEFKNEELCELCGHHELMAVIGAQVRALANLVQRGSTPPKLLIRGTPNKATVTLDGEQLGVTPLEIEVKPGPHLVELRAPGHVGQTHRWRAREGIEEVIDFELSATRMHRRGARIAGWVGFAAGVAGLGIGATLLAIDGHEHGPTCAADLRDINGRCPNVYATRTAGIVAASMGGAALITGISLVVYASPKMRRKNADQRGDRPVAEIVPRAGGVLVRF